MESSAFVTIIVKAPNQQIADQTVQCQLDWTIERLKNYLSEVYPSKPKLEEQKIIYSGKLLTDSSILKDVLRTFPGQDNHTVHLVCASKNPRKMTTPNVPTASRRNGSSSDTPASPTIQEIPTPVNNRGPVAGGVQFGGGNWSSQQAPNWDPRYFWPSATVPSNNIADMNQQMAYAQAYAQYVSFYMQMLSQQPGYGYMATVPPTVGSNPHVFQQPPVNNANVNNFQQNLPNGNENRPADLANPIAALGNDMDEEDEGRRRDWLDYFHVFTRMLILFTVVYYYTTPLRVVGVIAIALFYYVYHRRRHFGADVARANHDQNANNNNNADENRNGVAADDANRSRTPNAAADVSEPGRMSASAFIVSTLRSFFISLIPDNAAF